MEARIVNQGKNGEPVEIINPIKYDAEVPVFVGNAKQANNPLGYNAFIHWPKVKVKAGETVIFQISKDGKVINSF